MRGNPKWRRTQAARPGLGRRRRVGQDRSVQRRSFIVRSIWAACLLVAGLNHLRALVRHGLTWDYGGVAWPSAAYWTSLTFLDPIAAALLFVRPRVGIACTVAIIVTNVIHNLAAIAHYAPDGEFLARVAHPITLSQIAFLLFVGATARTAWRGIGAPSAT
jgi:hypothetical protein